MDKRKIPDLLHGEKVSPAYFREQSKLRKRLDEYQREKDKCLRKISNRQETLVNAFAVQQSMSQSMETFEVSLTRLTGNTLSTLNSEHPENMEIYRTQFELRKLSVGSDTRLRKLSSCSSEMKSKTKTIRQMSDPLVFANQARFESKVIAQLPRRKLTTGQIDVAVSSKKISPHSFRTDAFECDLSRNQSTTRTNVLSTELSSRQVSPAQSQSKSENEHSKINFATRLSSIPKTQLRMFNKTSAQVQSKHVNEGMKNTPKKLLHHRPKTSNENMSSFQGLPSVLSEESETLNRKAENYIHEIAPGTSVITKGQFKNTAEKFDFSEKSSREKKTPHSNNCNSEHNLNVGSEGDAGKSNKNVFRKSSLSADIIKRHLHEQTNVRSATGAGKDVRCLGNAWSEINSARRKISTVETPKEINENSSSKDKQSENESSASMERKRNFEALRNFRRLVLVAVAAERFSAKNIKLSPENREIIVPKRKLSSKARLEELQRPTESYLRQIMAEEIHSKKPRSRSESAVNAGKTSASGVTKFRRASQAAMATRILIDRENRKVTGTGFSSLGSRKETNQAKSLAEMMNELKNCRYLRTGSTNEQE